MNGYEKFSYEMLAKEVKVGGKGIFAQVYSSPVLTMDNKPAPKVQERYAIKRLGGEKYPFAIQDGRGFFYTPDIQKASTFITMDEAIRRISERNAAFPETDARFTVVKVSITTTPGTKTVREAKAGERADKWAIRANGYWFWQGDGNGVGTNGHWTNRVNHAHTFSGKTDATIFAVSGKLTGMVYGLEFVGLVESTTPESVKYDVQEL